MFFFFSSLLFLCQTQVSYSFVATSPSIKSYSFFHKNTSSLNKNNSNTHLSESISISALNSDMDENDESDFEKYGGVLLTSHLLFKLNGNVKQLLFFEKNLPDKKTSVKMCIINSVFRL